MKITDLLKKQRKSEEILALLKGYIQTHPIEKMADLKAAAILKLLGFTSCRTAKSSTSIEYSEGQRYLKQAISKNPKDSDTYATLAGTYKRLGNHDMAHELYRKALEVDPGDPYPLGNFLVYEILRQGYKLTMEKYGDYIERAIEKRSNQAEVLVDTPWVFFDLGTYHLLKGDIYKSLNNYLLAIKYSGDIVEIKTTIDTITRLEMEAEHIKGLDFACVLLMLGIAHQPKPQKPEDIAIWNSVRTKLDSKMQHMYHYDHHEKNVIMAGVTKKQEPVVYKVMRDRFLNVFNGFKGTIISGGTRAGICEIAGDIKEKYPSNIKVVGYHPANIPANTSCDTRYDKLVQTRGTEFSVLEPLQYWYDLIKSEVNPAEIKLIGYNGGPISALEFRMAIVFGAQTGIVGDSGRAATELVQNAKRWIEVPRAEGKSKQRAFKIMKNNVDEIRNFLTRPFVTDADVENLYRVSIHKVVDGSCLYEFSFAPFDTPADLFAGYMTALDSLGDEFKLGNIYGIKFRNGFLSGGYLSDLKLKVIFLLHDPPSISLERKMSEFIINTERVLGTQLHAAADTNHIYYHNPDIEKIYEAVFGKEIKKFFPK
nr:tetratricopeptide repeat protein [Candidatus Sigynarchaeota archaeon]